MKITNRVKAPIPKFFKVLQNIGLALAAVGGAILAAPIALPVVVTTVGGYFAVVGGVVSAVSQLTTLDEELLPSTGEIESKEGLRSLDKHGTSSAQPDNAPDEQE